MNETLSVPGADESSRPTTDETPEDETDELLDIGEESRWEQPKDANATALAPPAAPNREHDQCSSCWPKDWLSEDVSSSHVRLLAVDYESRVSEWQARSMPRNVLRRSMHDRAQEIAEQLKQAGVGKRPLIWVNSLGDLQVNSTCSFVYSRSHIRWADC